MQYEHLPHPPEALSLAYDPLTSNETLEFTIQSNRLSQLFNCYEGLLPTKF
jgi:hypothetical protein